MQSITRRRGMSLGLITVLALAIAAALSSGCAQRMAKFEKHWESGTEGLNRTITLRDYQGQVIGRWNAKTYIETREAGIVAFLDSVGHEVKLAGGIVVVQEN